MNLMRLWKKKENAAAAAAQLRNAAGFPLSSLSAFAPARSGEIRLYRAVRESVPLVDAAIGKIIRLVGGVDVKCADARAEKELREFLRTVPVGRSQVGINAFLEAYLDSMITCGYAIGEIVPERGRRGIAAVMCGRAENIEIREGESPLEFTICTSEYGGMMRPLPYQNLLLFTPFNPEADSPYGVSMLRNMPFFADILVKIYSAIGSNWERMGNVRFAVVYRPQGDGQINAKERSRQIADEWSKAMQSTKTGAVRDFVAVGDVDIKAIGADNQILDSEVPVRQLLEQMIARTGIPPFMLGLNWSSTERMSSQQADMLTSEMTAIRRTLTPVLEKICRMWLAMRGYGCAMRIVWDDINLQDEVEDAKAQLYAEQARKLRIENDREDRNGNF
jgi:hypothetical protein